MSTLRLYVMRHADAAAATHGGSDVERALSARGRAQAAAAGRALAASAPPPSMALVSSARRAQETFAVLVAHFPSPLPARTEDELYLAAAETLVRRLRSLEGSDALLLVAHQPGCGALVSLLVAGGVHDLDIPFATASVATLDLPGAAWGEVQPGGARLRHLAAHS